MNSIFRFLNKQNKIGNQEILFLSKSVVMLIILFYFESPDNQTRCMLSSLEASSFVVSSPFLSQLFANQPKANATNVKVEDGKTLIWSNMSVEVYALICGDWLFSYQQKRLVCVAIQIVSLRNVV